MLCHLMPIVSDSLPHKGPGSCSGEWSGMALPVPTQPSHIPGAGPHSHGAGWTWPSVPSPLSGQGHPTGAQCGTKPGTWRHPVHHPASPTHHRGCETHLQSHKTLKKIEPRGITLSGTWHPPAPAPPGQSRAQPHPCIFVPGVARASGQNPHGSP